MGLSPHCLVGSWSAGLGGPVGFCVPVAAGALGVIIHCCWDSTVGLCWGWACLFEINCGLVLVLACGGRDPLGACCGVGVDTLGVFPLWSSLGAGLWLGVWSCCGLSSVEPLSCGSLLAGAWGCCLCWGWAVG